MSKTNIRGVLFDPVDMSGAVTVCRSFLETEGAKVIHTPNSEIVQLCVKKPEYYGIVNSADLVIPDGAGVVMASKILGCPLTKGKVAGVELMGELMALAAETGAPVYLLGGRPASADAPSVADMAAEKLKIRYPGLTVAGTRDGYFKDADTPSVIGDINASGAKILCVCLGVPKQEKWTHDHRNELTSVRIAGCFGGSMDIYAGTAKRAPKFWIDHNLEWAYRLLKEPKRIGRMMALPAFILGCIGYRLTHGKEKQ